jgi:hypothetical protein
MDLPARATAFPLIAAFPEPSPKAFPQAQQKRGLQQRQQQKRSTHAQDETQTLALCTRAQITIIKATSSWMTN